MELRHFRYFLALAKELNFTKAAESLFISQPPLSRQIKDLELEIGAKLFDRSNRRVELTEAGKFLKREITNHMAELESILHQTKRISDNVNGDYRIGYISSIFSSTISNLVKFLSKKYPYLNIQLFEVSTSKQIKALEENKLDLAILRAPIISTLVSTELWFKDSYSVVFSPEHNFIQKAEELGMFQNETFVFYNKDYAPKYYETLLSICSNYGFVPNLVHESNNINSILDLVRNGLGISIVPSSLKENKKHEDLTFIKLSQRYYSEVLLAKPKRVNSLITDDAICYLKA